MRASCPAQIWLPIAAATVELAALGGLCLLCTAAYGDHQLLAEESATLLSHLALAAAAAVGGVLATWGTWLLVLRSRLWVILLVLTTCGLPAIFVACVFLYSLLVFRCLL